MVYGSGETKTQIDDGFLADHKMIKIEVQIEGTGIGKSYWKCKSDLLHDEHFKMMVAEEVPKINADKNTEGVSCTLLLETTLSVLRGKIIKHAVTQKRQRAREF